MAGLLGSDYSSAPQVLEASDSEESKQYLKEVGNAMLHSGGSIADPASYLQ